MTWRLELSAKAQKELDHVPEPDRAKILFRLWDLKTDPNPRGCVKITGSHYWRLRQGNWRAIYLIDPESHQVLIARVVRRNERTYEGLS